MTKIIAAAKIKSSLMLDKYLGTPCITSRAHSGIFSSILDRLGGRLEGWMTKYLSLAVRTVLAQSTLNSIPLYIMQSAILLINLCNKIDRLVRDFLWGSSNDRKHVYLLNWDCITKDRQHGGLGIKRMHNMNLALTEKLGWRPILKGDSMWTRILASKYVREEINLDKLIKKHGSSNAWRGISSATDLLKRGARITVYNSQNTLFWRDSWLGDFLLINLALQEISFTESFKQVSDYWDPI